MARVVVTTNTLMIGGAETQRVHLANGLSRRGHEVQLVALQQLGPLRDSVDSRIAVQRRRYWAGAEAAIASRSTPRLLISGTTRTEMCFGTAWRRAPFGGSRRWVVAAHNAAEPDTATYPKDVARLCRSSDGMIFLSDTHRTLLNKHQDLNTVRTWSIPNGIALSTTARVASLETEFRIGFIGRIVPDKGLDVALAALGSLSEFDWRLVVIGDGPSRQHLERSVNPSIAQRVQFLGWRKDVLTLLSSFDLVILPSMREALPMVLLEAMAAGVPVMATGVGAIPELLRDGAGFMLPDGDVASWSKALRQVILSPEQACLVGQRGKERAEAEYSLDFMVDRYEEVIDDLNL